MMGQQRVYNALDGLEIKKLILAQIERELNVDTAFKQNRTFNMVSWDWNLEIRCTLQDRGPEKRKVAGEIQACDPQTRQPIVPPDDAEKFLLEVSTGQSPIKTPDKAREEAGLAIPTATKTTAGTVDAPVINRDRTEKTKTVSLRKETSGVPAQPPAAVAPRDTEQVGHHIPVEKREVIAADPTGHEGA